jgi:hypothetical protein
LQQTATTTTTVTTSYRGVQSILAWKDPFEGMIKYAKTGVTSYYTIEVGCTQELRNVCRSSVDTAVFRSTSFEASEFYIEAALYIITVDYMIIPIYGTALISMTMAILLRHPSVHTTLCFDHIEKPVF